VRRDRPSLGTDPEVDGKRLDGLGTRRVDAVDPVALTTAKNPVLAPARAASADRENDPLTT